MLSLFTRRVALSAYRSRATYSRILPPSASTLRDKRISNTSLHTGPARTFTDSRRNASTKATVTTDGAKSTTTGRTNPRKKLTPELIEARKRLIELEKKQKADRAAALRAKKKAQAEKKKEAAALKRKRLAEDKKKLAEAKKAKVEKEKERERAREAKKPKLIKPPPRTISGFALFISEERKPAPEVAANWRNLSEEAKQEYIARAKVMSEKRKEEFEAFKKTVTPSDAIRYNRSQKSKGATRIRFKLYKRPLTAFIRYAQEFRMRPDQAGKPVIEVSKAAGEVWRSMTQEEKDQYKHKPTESTTA